MLSTLVGHSIPAAHLEQVGVTERKNQCCAERNQLFVLRKQVQTDLMTSSDSSCTQQFEQPNSMPLPAQIALNTMREYDTSGGDKQFDKHKQMPLSVCTDRAEHDAGV